MSKLHIKNMVCNRCIMVVENELEKLGFGVKQIQLGEVELEQNLDEQQKTMVYNALEPLGFELIDDKKSQIIEKIKVVIIELVHHQKERMKTNLSEVIAKAVNHDYQSLSKLFSEVEGITIEKYFIAQKIEKVKELLVYDELTLSEIAYKLDYSSVAYLSNQFKKVTGLTPSHFRRIKKNRRTPLDKV